MKKNIGDILFACLLIFASVWAFYESSKELQETIKCDSANYECVYTKSCPFLTPSYSKVFYLPNISLKQHKRFVKNSKGNIHSETDNFITIPGEPIGIRVSHKIYAQLSEYKQNPAGNLFYQNYQIGVIPGCILFFIVGVSFLINACKKGKD